MSFDEILSSPPISNNLKSVGSFFLHSSHIIRGKLLYASRPTKGATCEIDIVIRLLSIFISRYIYVSRYI